MLSHGQLDFVGITQGLTLSDPHPGECLEKATDRAGQRGGRHEKT